jgi:tetratricopeptide (TPR) repeat protein
MLFCCFLFLAGTAALFADPVRLYEEGQSYQETEDWYSAIESYQQALQENPSYNLVYQGLSECFYALGEYEQALDQVIKAESFKKNDPVLLNLHGFTLVGLARLDEASAIFNRVLASWPNDINARFGIAEIDISSGCVSAASGQYIDALRRNPENRKALLSLALLSRETGNNAAAREYIAKALQFHGNNPQVFYFSAYLSSLEGQNGEAEGRVRTALSLNPSYDDARELLATILYKTGRYTEVIDICDTSIASDRNYASAWYLRSLSLEKLKRHEEAIKSAQTGLQVAPGDELLRSLMEGIIIRELSFEDIRRASWASFHAEKARQFERDNMSDQALYEYRRALKVNPYDTASRFSYAKLLLSRGYPERYVEQLQFIQSLGKSTNAINDALESYEKLLVNSIPKKWKIDPLNLDKAHTSIGFYYQNDPSNVIHPDSERITTAMIGEVFSYDLRFSASARDTPVSSYSEAFRTSREKGEDYFALVTFRENKRDVQITVDLYVSKTGSRADSFSVFRTGNDRYPNALRRLVQTIASSMPVRGAVVNRNQADAVIDLGKSDGVVVGSVYDIALQNTVTVKNEGIGLQFAPEGILGTFTVTAVGEDVSQGKLDRNGFFDRVNSGDAVLSKIKEAENAPKKTETAPRSPPALLSLLRKIR